MREGPASEPGGEPSGPEHEGGGRRLAGALAARRVLGTLVSRGAKTALFVKGLPLLALGVVFAGVMVLLLLPVMVHQQKASAQACNGATEQAVGLSGNVPQPQADLMVRAANQVGLGPRGAAVLAGIADKESDFGRSNAAGVHDGVNFLGCCRGPFQFNDNTWPTYASDGDGDGKKDVFNFADAAVAAAKKVKADLGKAGGDYSKSLLAYNNSSKYVHDVLSLADHYESQLTGGPTITDVSLPRPAATPTAGAVDLNDGQPHVVAATSFDYPDRGHWGDKLSANGNQLSFAELGGESERAASLLGGLPYDTELKITYTDEAGKHHSITARKLHFSFGMGKTKVDGHRVAISLWHQAAEQLGFSGTGVVTVQAVNPLPVATPEPNVEQASSCGGDGPLPDGLRARIVTIAEREEKKWRNHRPGDKYFEGPGNVNPYSKTPEEWCADFANWVWREAGVKPYPTGAYVPDLQAWAEQHHVWKTGNPQPGDMIDFWGHVALVEKVKGDTITIIGGNQTDKVTRRGPARPDTFEHIKGHTVDGYVSPPGADGPATGIDA